MPLYEFHCTACKKTASFASEHDAAVAEWSMITVRARGKVKHFVYCPAHEPSFVETLIGAKKK